MSAILDYPQRHAISANEYLRMGEGGVFAADARLELIEGEIVETAPIGSGHAGEVNILTGLFVRLVGTRAVVAVQNPLVIGDRSVPQPDLVLLKPRAHRYASAHPTPADVLLVIEVADTTLSFDLATKIPLHARHGVTESWVVDLEERVIRVFRDPSMSGYRTSFTVSVGGSVSPSALPDVIIAVSVLFPA